MMRNDPIILLKPSLGKEEIEAARKHFKVALYPTELPEGAFVIPRYSILPDAPYCYGMLDAIGVSCANTLEQHNYIANMEWVEDLGAATAKTYFDKGYGNVPPCTEGWVVKGKTNSHKVRWDTHMRAKDREALRDVFSRLLEHDLYREQGLVIREYVPLAPYLEDGEPLVLLNGLPVVLEWRFFFWSEQIIQGHFYWGSQVETLPDMPPLILDFALAQAKVISDAQRAQFFVLDVALTQEGHPIIIEVNDGQQSGLNGLDPGLFYSSLRKLF